MAMKAKIISQVYHKRMVLWEHIPIVTPWVVYIEPSGYCNLKCKFCPHGIRGGNVLKNDIMDFSVFKKVIDDMSDFPQKVRLLRICGNGEPLMNKNILAMLSYAKEKGNIEKIEMLTNAVLLSPQLTRSLPSKLTRIIISIEGLSGADYKRVCGVSIDFKDLLTSLDILYSNKGECKIHVKIHHEAVSSETRKQKFFDLFGNKCDEICVEKLVPMWPQLSSSYFVNEFRWGGEESVARRSVCVQMFKGLQIQADGEVVPCCVDWKRVNILGNINKDSIINIWNGIKLRELQIEHLSGNKGNLKPCSDCTMNDYCDFDNIDFHAEECIRRLNVKRNG